MTNRLLLRTLVPLAVLGVAPLLLAAEGCGAQRPVGPAESGTVTQVVPQLDRDRERVEVSTPDGQLFTVRLAPGDCAVGDRYPDCTTD